MTLKEYADNRGISPQAVYKRLKQRQINPSELKLENSRQLSEKGIQILNEVFNQIVNKSTSQPVNQLSVDESELNRLKDELNASRTEIEQLRRQISSLTEVADQANKRADGLQEALYREQHNLELQLLALAAPKKKRFRWWWQKE